MPLSSPFLELVALVILLNTYLEQACYSSIKLYSGHSLNLHLNCVFLLVGIGTLSYLINKMHANWNTQAELKAALLTSASFYPLQFGVVSNSMLGAWEVGILHCLEAERARLQSIKVLGWLTEL